MAGSSIAARVGVEGVADAASVAGAQGTGDLTVGGDVSSWDLANELIDLIKEVHVLGVLTA